MVLVKRLLAISVSCITYLRGLFPESSYGTRYLDGFLHIPLKHLVLVSVMEMVLGQLYMLMLHTFNFLTLVSCPDTKWQGLLPPVEGEEPCWATLVPWPAGNISCTKMSFAKGVSSEEIKKGSILLIRKLYLLMQNLGPLPNDIILTMKLFYYSDVTPDDYQPPGFKEDSSPDNLLFDGDPVNLKVGSISTGFHILKVRVTTESRRMRTLGSSLIQGNGPTEISHQGLDCDEEEEGSTKLFALQPPQGQIPSPSSEGRVEQQLLAGHPALKAACASSSTEGRSSLKN
ncbi:HORMA domain-containing protein 2 [Chelonia mydas]|uniref:HORMA domain-containing protein 2 n=1 Tax=Chelonia mydas TaxID=8469 RepID=M7B607_CHEMY|nr:HORMA domain-containing protein 2 [Chelonia mydas]